MSITNKKFLTVLSVCFGFLPFIFNVSAQDVEVNIKLISDAPAVLLVEGKFTRENKIQAEKSRSFVRSFAGVENLGARVSELKLKDAHGQIVSFKKLIDGEYLAEHPAIFWSYRINTDSPPNKKTQIVPAHFPKHLEFGRWEADIRGAASVIFSSDMPFKTLSLQRFYEQLRHEICHLWIPENLALTGIYDWFYEGFTVYQALKTGVRTNQIRFEDFLDTLSQAYNPGNFQERRISLIEASKNRWNAANNQIYSCGMPTAFLCDVALLRNSRGNRSIDDIFREIYNKYRVPNKSRNGSAAILNVLESYAELREITEKYIKGTEKISWRTDLESVGIEASENDFNTKLNVRAKLDKRQKDLLNKLGYNNWRKILEQ